MKNIICLFLLTIPLVIQAQISDATTVVGYFTRKKIQFITQKNYLVQSTDNWIVSTYDKGIVLLSLPDANMCPGREIMIRTNSNQPIFSDCDNIVSDIGITSNILVGKAGKWATIVATGDFWYIVQNN